MSITLPLQPQEEAQLAAVAQARGLSTNALLREAIEKILATAPEPSLKHDLETGIRAPPANGRKYHPGEHAYRPA